jgi:hypothetical protein
MKIRYLFLLLAFCFNTGWAEFSDALFRLHPIQPKEAEPYLIEISGEWPSDCHPGEQKPVIRDYTGDTALIEFETIVEHITCNDVPTPYRVLVDMSDVIDSVTGAFVEIEVTLRFGETEFTKILELVCICSPVPVGPHINPEAGLYYSDGLEKQGLLLARQNQRMGAFPLIYDESGSSEWLIGAGGIVEDVFFADLLESTGGQCLGCLPPDEQPKMGVVGKISILMDSEGIIQVKVNDGLFETYEPLSFGYGEVNIGGSPTVRIPDLSGRWAFIDGDTEWGVGTPPPTIYLPLVFDITLESVFKPDLIVTVYPPGNAAYSIRNMEGEIVAEMLCEYESAMVCELEISADPDGYAVKLLSPERMILSSLKPISSGGIGMGTAVRID